MDKINDGGPAFPPHWDPKTHPSGMTLRDYFAAKAMQGMLADSQTRESCPEDHEEKWVRSFARVCYEFADAMLAARGQQP